MDVRDQAAIAAMAVFLRRALALPADAYVPAVVAAQAYQLADAMMLERTRGAIVPVVPGAPDGRCINGYRAHRWDPTTLTCFRCRRVATTEARTRARKLFGGVPRQVPS